MRSQRQTASLLVVMLVALALPAVSANAQRTSARQSGAVRAVESFYRFHFAHDRNFNAANVRARRSWFSPELNRLLAYELRREALFVKAHPDEVPYMEGDPFTNSQEYPDSFQVGQATSQQKMILVPVTFSWRGTSEARTINVEVVESRGRWLIHNFLHADAPDLLKQLRRPVYDANVQ